MYGMSTPASLFISKESDVQSVRDRAGFVTDMDHSTLISGTRKHSLILFFLSVGRFGALVLLGLLSLKQDYGTNLYILIWINK
jgi:hypothetical protein